jgi:ribosome maturation factor RimP
MAAVELETLIEDSISRQGVHLVDFVVRGEGKSKSVEVYIDSEQSITTEICSEISRELDRVLEKAGIERGTYRLTVSSPGIARPLKYSWQYKKHVGRELDIKVLSPEGLRSVIGKLESMDDNGIVLSLGKKSEREVIAHNAIVEARVRAPW